VTPDGRKTYVTLNGVDDVAIIDNITGTTTLLGGLGLCTGPQGIAMGLPGGVPTAFVGCSNRRIAVIDASTDTLVSANTYGSGGASFYGVAVTPNDALVYVTDSANDQFVVLNAATAVEIAGSPFAAGVTAPHGDAISNDGARVYIAGSGSDDVIAISTADNTTIVSTGAASISTGAGSSPEQIAVTPSGARVFVTLTGTDKFAVFNDSATPSLNTTVSLALASSPFGVTIPPLLAVPVTGVRVYIGEFSLDDVAIINDETGTPFGTNAASPIALAPFSSPIGMAHIPVPR
jgi:DNA-binding beta-propeller fold protein YncE